jgi:hypothetical protein
MSDSKIHLDQQIHVTFEISPTEFAKNNGFESDWEYNQRRYEALSDEEKLQENVELANDLTKLPRSPMNVVKDNMAEEIARNIDDEIIRSIIGF